MNSHIRYGTMAPILLTVKFCCFFLFFFSSSSLFLVCAFDLFPFLFLRLLHSMWLIPGTLAIYVYFPNENVGHGSYAIMCELKWKQESGHPAVHRSQRDVKFLAHHRTIHQRNINRNQRLHNNHQRPIERNSDRWNSNRQPCSARFS